MEEHKPLSLSEKVGISAGLICVTCTMLLLLLGGMPDVVKAVCTVLIGLSFITLLAMISVGIANLIKAPSDSSSDDPED